MNETADEATLKFYGEDAERYAERTGTAPTLALKEFLNRLSHDSLILALGCGSGRDSTEMLRQGYNVVSTDGSPEMARQAEKRLNRPVSVLEFGEIEEKSKFDGVWANACLLHLPKDRLRDVIARIHRALRPKGILFASFKAGDGEGCDKLGRFFNYLSPVLLRTVFEEAAPWASIAIEGVPGVGYDGVPATWLNCTAIK
jgi:SAM-dependent methyltransferase